MSTKSVAMKQQNDPQKALNLWDALKWLLVVLLIVGGIGLNYYYNQQPLSLRLIGWIAVFAVAAGLALTTSGGRAFLDFSKESRTELRKVVWPSREETIQTTLLVIAFVIVLSLILWCIDAVLMWGISLLTGQRG